MHKNNHNVPDVITLALTQLAEQRNETALALLNYWSFLDNQAPIQKPWLAALLPPSAQLDSALENLHHFSLIETAEQDKFRMHQAVQIAIRKKIKNDAEKIEILRKLSAIFQEILSADILNNANTHPEFVCIIPHIISIINHINEHKETTEKNWQEIQLDLKNIIYLLIGVAKFQIHYPELQETNHKTPYQQAEQTLLHAIDLCNCLPDKGNTLEADVKLELGDTLQCQARYKEAQQYFLEVIAIKKALLSPPNSIGHVYHALSYTFFNLNEPSKALEYSNLALTCFEEAFGKNAEHPYIAAVYRAQGKIHQPKKYDPI